MNSEIDAELICYSIWFMALSILVFRVLFHFHLFFIQWATFLFRSFVVIVCWLSIEMAGTKECIACANHLKNLKAPLTLVTKWMKRKRKWIYFRAWKRVREREKERKAQTLSKEVQIVEKYYDNSSVHHNCKQIDFFQLFLSANCCSFIRLDAARLRWISLN